jgi:hypothetical protein
MQGVCGPQLDEEGQLPLPQVERAEGERAPKKRQLPRREDGEWRGRDRERGRGEEYGYLGGAIAAGHNIVGPAR